MTQGTIRLFLIERVATDRLKDIEMIGGLPALGHLGMPFTGKTGPVTGFAKEIHIEFPDRIRAGGVMPTRRAITASGKPGQDGGPADPTNGLAHVGIREPCAPGSQTINIGCLDQGMTIAASELEVWSSAKKKTMLGCLAACAEQANRKQKVMLNFFILVSRYPEESGAYEL